MLRYNIAASWEHKVVRIGERIVRDMAEVRMAIFRLNRPIVGDGIFDAAAESEARAGVRDGRVGAGNTGEESGRIDISGVEAGYGDAAGAEEQEAVPGNAEASADRALDTPRWSWPSCFQTCLLQSRPRAPTTVLRKLVPSTDPSMPATNHGVRLDVVAEMGAADDPLRTLAE